MAVRLFDGTTERNQITCFSKVTNLTNFVLWTDDKTDEDQTINLAARWIQLQAQFALRLQQQSEIAEKKVKPEPETTPQPTRPLDLNNKTGPPNLMSFASLMMDSWSNTSSSSTSSAGMTALQKISHLAQRSLAIPAAASATDRFPPVNHSSSPFSILQMPYGGLKSSSPHHWPPVPAPAAHPRWIFSNVLSVLGSYQTKLKSV